MRQRTLRKFQTFNRIPCSSEEEVMITNGSTGAFVAACLTLLEPGDEVIQFEPFYGYHVQLLKVLGFKPKFVPLRGRSWEVDFDALRAAIGPRTKAVVVTNPGNPNGKVWQEAELKQLLRVLQEHDLWAFTDEVYEFMTYDGNRHLSLAALPSGWERTVTMSSFSKTYNMTGWRLGSAVAPAHIIEKMGLINDLIYICPPTPLQHGLAQAFDLPESYFTQLAADYDRKRSLFCEALSEAGFDFDPPQGAYYVFASFEPLHRAGIAGFENDEAACHTLIRETGIGTVPGRSFFSDPAQGRFWLRFCYAKEYPVLERACTALRNFGQRCRLKS
ncbi:pyridoxal phosphate-dependent aminotransferase [Cyclonatronum proteinivorum]|uniref:pyridoxal phosphate-dependent aminotransferase n=1 Tax=Cyclonatronum proteinivorum TaxID=1457365 RepID=UPI0022CF1A6A|nr:pyridoxal phosphate-dependent aminotransferase [Cyclonatronum proteinivorum]